MDTADRAGPCLRRGRLRQTHPAPRPTREDSRRLGRRFPTPLLKPLGLAELRGAVGPIVPPLVRIAPVLAAVAAGGLTVTMIGAIITHARRGEYPNVAINVVLATMAATVAWGRFGPYSFS